MCMSCVAGADAALASGILGVAGARVGLRRYFPTRSRRARARADVQSESAEPTPVM